MKIISIVIKLLYKIFSIRKINENKIIFLSRQSDKKSLDFSILEKEIYKRNTNANIIFITKKIDKISKNIFSNIIYVIKSTYHLSNSKYCITDSYNPVISCIKKREGQIVIQIWHALGAIKKFGYQSIDTISGRSSNLASDLNMHANYDYIISGSKEMTKFFMEAFNYKEDVFRNYGLPRIDYLRNNKEKIKKEIIKSYPNLNNGKINILYAPTFRTYNSDNTDKLIKLFKSNKYNLIIKAHMNQQLKASNINKLCYDKYSALDLLCVADYLITDYSAIAIEAASIDIKTLYYVYDYEEYKQNNGINIDLYKEMPNCVFTELKDIKNIIDNNDYNIKELRNYSKKFLPNNKNKQSAELIVDLIYGGTNESNKKSKKSN